MNPTAEVTEAAVPAESLAASTLSVRSDAPASRSPLWNLHSTEIRTRDGRI